MTRIISAEKFENITLDELVDGEYRGKWSAYQVAVELEGSTYRMVTEHGVRGIDIPCTITVKGGNVTVEAD